MAEEKQMLEALTPAKPPPLPSNGMESNLPGPSLGPSFALRRRPFLPQAPRTNPKEVSGVQRPGEVPVLHFPVLAWGLFLEFSELLSASQRSWGPGKACGGVPAALRGQISVTNMHLPTLPWEESTLP